MVAKNDSVSFEINLRQNNVGLRIICTYNIQ